MVMNVIFLDDLLRYDFWPAKEFFYDNLRFIFNETSIISSGISVRMGLSEDDVSFLNGLSWIDNYNKIDSNYYCFLDSKLDFSSLIIGYELTPGLIDYLNDRGITWINFRVSPIRFADDLLVSITSSSDVIRGKITNFKYPCYNVKLKAHKMMASYRHKNSYNPTNNNGVYFIGQTESDASLIDNGKLLRIENFIHEISSTKSKENIFYLKHPSSSDKHANVEIETLGRVYNKVICSDKSIYDLFMSDGDIKFLSISSGSIQESLFFNKDADFLFKPICEMAESDFRCDNFMNITFQNFIDCAFWYWIFGLNDNMVIDPSKIKDNELRILHDVWWGYSRYLSRENGLSMESHRPIYNSIELLSKKTNKIINLLSYKPSLILNLLIGFYGGCYSLFDRVVIFERNGDVTEDGYKVGKWRITRVFRKEIILIWDNSNWVDIASSQDRWKSMHCENNTGDRFIMHRHTAV